MPVVQLESADSRKLTRVVSHNCEVMVQGDRSNHRIVGTDWKPFRFQVDPNLSVQICRIIIKRQADKWTRKD